MNIALYGGSFDPPHAGHVRIVNEALNTLPIDYLVIIPAWRNPFKPGTRADGNTRLTWLKEIFAQEKRVIVSDFELSCGRSMYTIETVHHFLRENTHLYLIIGADNLEKLHLWHQFDELNALVQWVVATRNNISIPPDMIRLEVDIPVSSTEFHAIDAPLGLSPEIETKIITYYKEHNESKN